MSAPDYLEFMRVRAAGLSPEEMAEHFGVDLAEVHAWLWSAEQEE